MSKRFTLPGKARLKRQQEFNAIHRQGRKMRAGPLRVSVLKRADGQSRLGLAIGVKVGGAVLRNRWKRAIREAFRLNRHRLNQPHDIVVSVNWDAKAEQVREVADAFLKIVELLNGGDAEGGGR